MTYPPKLLPLDPYHPVLCTIAHLPTARTKYHTLHCTYLGPGSHQQPRARDLNSAPGWAGLGWLGCCLRASRCGGWCGAGLVRARGALGRAACNW